MTEQEENRIDVFLDLYKQAEEALEEKYQGERRRHSSIVMKFLKAEESEPVREKLDICREIRNLLTHNANLNGEPVAVPSASVVKAMEEALEFIKRPPLALEFATRGERLMKAELNQKVLKLMELMDQNGYSHIPVMREGRFFGVFSAGAVFRYQLRDRKALTPETTLRELEKYLDIKEHMEHYEFVSRKETYLSVRKKFEKVKGKNQRVSVVFITETGRPGQRLLGMLTPWDVLGDPA